MLGVRKTHNEYLLVRDLTPEAETHYHARFYFYSSRSYPLRILSAVSSSSWREVGRK
jgi:hypothetical protein